MILPSILIFLVLLSCGFRLSALWIPSLPSFRPSTIKINFIHNHRPTTSHIYLPFNKKHRSEQLSLYASSTKGLEQDRVVGSRVTPSHWTKFKWWCVRVLQGFQRILSKVRLWVKTRLFFLSSLRIVSASHTVYVLELEGGYFYVGSTSRDVSERWKEHLRERGGSKWTRAHRPVRLLYSERVQEQHVLGLETQLTCKMMRANGINRVRGGQFCQDTAFSSYDKAIISSLVSTIGHSLNMDYKAVDVFVKSQLAPSTGQKLVSPPKLTDQAYLYPSSAKNAPFNYSKYIENYYSLPTNTPKVSKKSKKGSKVLNVSLNTTGSATDESTLVLRYLNLTTVPISRNGSKDLKLYRGKIN